jgi:hypothetical protein
MAESVGNYVEQRWAELPHFVCLRCGYSAVEDLARLTTHLQVVHGETAVAAAQAPSGISVIAAPRSEEEA